MPFPESEREVFPRNVIDEAICQLRFPPILKIKAIPPYEFQDQIRADYPLQEEESMASLLPPELAEAASGLSITLGAADTTHKFLTVDKQRVVSLSPNFLALSEKHYTNRDDFRTAILEAAQAFQSIYEPAFYTRIGVRYKNVINRKELGIDGTSWVELLNNQLLGELGAAEIRDDVTQILTRVEMGGIDELDSKVQVNHGLARDAENETVYFLDADFFTTHERGADDVSPIVASFSELNGRFFRWAITERLKVVLREPSRD